MTSTPVQVRPVTEVFKAKPGKKPMRKAVGGSMSRQMVDNRKEL